MERNNCIDTYKLLLNLMYMYLYWALSEYPSSSFTSFSPLSERRERATHIEREKLSLIHTQVNTSSLTHRPYLFLILLSFFHRWRLRDLPTSSVTSPGCAADSCHTPNWTGSHQAHVSQPMCMWSVKVVLLRVRLWPWDRGCGSLSHLA